MRRSGSTTRLAFLAVFTFLGCEQASTSQSLEEIRGSVTIERPCQYGTETELVAKKGDIVRLTFPENPSGRREFILLPKADTLEWHFLIKRTVYKNAQRGADATSTRKTDSSGLEVLRVGEPESLGGRGR